MTDQLRHLDVLDHGYVRLVDFMGSDLSIVRAARVSYAAAWRAGQDEGSDQRLVHYLWTHGHTTPFEAVTVTLEVKAPIFVFRQWHRHRTQSYNELSARYRPLPEEYYIPDPEVIGLQSQVNKQGRTMVQDEVIIKEREMESNEVRLHSELAFNLYKKLLDRGWPRELARMVLPVNTYSHMFTTMNLLNLFRFLTLRTDPHAQFEIRQYAEAIITLVRPIAPVAMSAWENHHGREGT